MPVNYELDRDRENNSGIYYLYWSEGKRNKRKSLRTKDHGEAQKAYGKLLLGTDVKAAEDKGFAYTVADLWPVYMVGKIAKGSSEAGATLCWKFLEPFFGHLTVPEVNQSTADKYVLQRVTGKAKKREQDGALVTAKAVQPQTVRKELSYIVSCLNFCSLPKFKKKMFDPALIEHLDLPEDGEPKDRWLTTAEIALLHAAADRLSIGSNRLTRIQRFLYLGLGSAGREQALYDLTWDRVDWETRVINLDVPGRKKTKKRRAQVPINDMLFGILWIAHDERISDLVLDNKGAIWATLQLVVAEAGLAPKGWVWPGKSQKPKATGVSPHTLRHTAATHMARAGVSLWKIAKYLGNTIAMVEKVYAKHCPDDLRDAADVMSMVEPQQARPKLRVVA